MTTTARSLTAVHQLVPNFDYGDAIGNHVRALRGLLRDWGYASDVYAQYMHETLIADAKDVVLGLARAGWRPPPPRRIRVIGESGQAAKSITYAYSNVFIFTPGEYVVELFVDSELLKWGTFYVADQ